MRKGILILIIFIISEKSCAQIFDFDSSYVIASSPSFDYKNPSYSTRNNIFHFSNFDFLCYEKHSNGVTSNIVLRKFDWFQYFGEIEVTTDQNTLNLNCFIKSPSWEYHLCFITWQSNSSGDWDIYYAIYNDSTSSFQTPPTLVDTSNSDETNPHIAFDGTKIIFSYERDNDIYIKRLDYGTGTWYPDTNITSVYSKPCTNHDMINNGGNWGIIFQEGLQNENKLIRFDIFRILNQPNYYLRYNPDSLLVNSLNPQPNITNTLMFNEFNFDTLGKQNSKIVTKNLEERVFSTHSFPGNFYQGRVSIYPIITEGDPPSPVGFVRKYNDSTTVCFGSVQPYEFSSYKRHYVSDSAYYTKLDISTYLLNGIGIKYNAAWNKPIDGRSAIVGSHGVYFLSNINQISTETPYYFILHQNYPNPFNPVTRIRFEIPSGVRGERSEVRLTVYDISGKEVAVLVNGELQPGVYEYEFDGGGLGSGVYFYKLQSGEFTETKKMLLIK